MSDALTISSSLEDYLEVILELSEKNDAVRVTDIAAMLNIAKASVSQTVSRLKEMGLVNQESYGPLELTGEGRKLAVKVRQRHRLLKKFLVEVLEVDSKVAEKDACLMEHVVSPQTVKKLIEYMEKACPSNETAMEDCNADILTKETEESQGLKSINIRALSELKPGRAARIIRVAARGSVRRRMVEMGITPGAEIKMMGVAPMGDPIEILIKGYRLSLRKDEAAEIFVEVF